MFAGGSILSRRFLVDPAGLGFTHNTNLIPDVQTHTPLILNIPLVVYFKNIENKHQGVRVLHRDYPIMSLIPLIKTSQNHKLLFSPSCSRQRFRV